MPKGIKIKRYKINIIIGLKILANSLASWEKIILIRFKKDGLMKEIIIKKMLKDTNVTSKILKKLRYKRIKKIIKKIADNCIPKLLLLITVVSWKSFNCSCCIKL